MNINSTPSNKIQISNKTKIKNKKNFFIIIVNNHVKIHQSAIQKYTTLETAKIQKTCYIIAVSRRPQNCILFSGNGGTLLDGCLQMIKW